MSARRSTRVRRKPTPIYQVEDARPEEREDVDESSDDIPSDEEFNPLKTKRKTPKKPRTPSAPRSARRKRSPWSAARSARERRSKKSEEVAAGEETVDAQEALFEAVKRGKRPLETLLSEWRDRFEADEEPATREVLRFVLQACGGAEESVPDTALAQLEMSDLVEHVVAELEKENGEYPLASRGKGMRKFHRSFEDFWDVFMKECYESEILFSSEIVATFVDWLTTLSSSEVRAIRHTSTVAVLALSNALVSTGTTISEQLAIATRQLNAELNVTTSETGDPQTRKSPNARKVALLKENKALYETRLEQVLKLVNLVFTGVVVHRYRDVMPEIRVASMQCLGHWITTMPDQFLKDNFLKYLGWLLNDKAAPVRLEVIQILCELYENDEFTTRLESLTVRFLPRYFELCNDVDDAVVEECIHLLIAVDKCSLISSDIVLQPVEKLVFDADHEDIRKAAAEFVCLQYDAFGVAVAQTKDAKLKKEQLNTQAIALVEFSEEYIQNHGIPVEAVDTLVDAFWGLEDCLVLQDWRLMTNLLLVDKSAPDLSSDQQTILLRLLVASVRKLVGGETGHGTSASAKKEADALREEITVEYCKDIPNLFHLYQADSDKLALILQLIPMLSLKTEVIGHHSGPIKELLEKLKHAYLVHSDEDLLSSLSLSISHLLHTEHASLKREADVIVHELLQELMEKIDNLLVADSKLCEILAASGVKGKKARGRKKKAKTKEISDTEYSLRVSLCRLKCLISYTNIREYVLSDPALSAMSGDLSPLTQRGSMDILVSAIGELIGRRTKTVLELDPGLRHVDTVKHGLMIIYSDLLWTTAPIFKSIEENKSRNGSPDTSNDADATEVDPSIQLLIQKVCQARGTFEEVVVSILQMHLARTQDAEEHKESEELDNADPLSSMEEVEFEDEDVAAYVKEAQRFAFLTFCDLRCLFVEKFQDAVAPFNELEWRLPKILVLLTQVHFEKEMEDADEEEPEIEDDASDDDLAEKADAIRVWKEKQRQKAEFLIALGRVSLCNPSNKKQAAAVLEWFTSSGKSSVEVVKAFGKQVKSDAPVRYLEIQMTALRQLFNSLLIQKQDLEAMTTDNLSDEEVAEFEEFKERVEAGEQELKELAKRFSQSLGVGKIASSLRAPFLRFLREGVRYSLEQSVQYEFLETMRVYLSHLDRSTAMQLREFFLERVKSLGDVPTDGEDLSSDWRAVFDFQAAITAACVGNGKQRTSLSIMGSPPLKNKRRSASSQPTPMQRSSIAEEDEDLLGENESNVVTRKPSSNDEEDELHVGDSNQGEASNHKRAAEDEDELQSMGGDTPRKRPRIHRGGEGEGAEGNYQGTSTRLSVAEDDEERKTEDDEPPRNIGVSQPDDDSDNSGEGISLRRSNRKRQRD